MSSTVLKMPIGQSDFRFLIEGKYYFVDKSLFIQEILEDTQIILITRPRRFGKTLNLSMLHYFFSQEVDEQSTAGLFEGLKIQEAPEEIRQHQGRYPVIFLTFKDLKCTHFEETYQDFCRLISSLYKEHRYLIQSEQLALDEKKEYQAILEKNASPSSLRYSLKTLSEYLHRHHKVAPIILIDEYDTPIQSGYLNGYYPQIVELFRAFLGSALKDNPHCFKAVLTGILRVSKESLFSGLNNIRVYSMLNERYGQYFGFTEEEVQDLLERAGLSERSAEIRCWYNGYQIGRYTVYNPWSLLNCVDEKGLLKCYWLNTSDNALVKECLYRSGLIHEESFERLLEGKTVECLINENIVFSVLQNLIQHDSVILSFLLMAGYFKVVSVKYIGRSEPQCQLAIPNKEIKILYAELVEEWLVSGQSRIQSSEFLNQLLQGDIEAFEESFQFLLENTISVHDLSKEPEAFYHGFMIGLTAHIQFHRNYCLKSNRESGQGRYDYLILSKDPNKPTLLMEFKRVRPNKTHSSSEVNDLLEKTAHEALAQIENKIYYQEAKQYGSQSIFTIALAFCGKQFKLVYSEKSAFGR